MGHGNCSCTVFPDGTRYFLVCHSGDFKTGIKASPPYRDLSLPPSPRSHINSMKRSVSSVFECARSNVWDYFITLTFDGSQVDRYDYEACSALVCKFTDALRYRGCGWIIVPEQHTGETYLKRGLPIPPDYKPGAFHFHGLVSGNLPVSFSGKYDSAGNEIYNIDLYHFGHNSASFIRSQSRVSSYISKYLTKCDCVPKGKKRFWRSRNLAVPEHQIIVVSAVLETELAQNAVYSKKISNAYGEYDFYEIAP